MFKRTPFTVFEFFHNTKVTFDHFNALLLKSINFFKKNLTEPKLLNNSLRNFNFLPNTELL